MDRQRAEVFDREAESYDRFRPSYPEELVDEILGTSPVGLSVLDIACGTGIASRQFARRGASVLGVELNAGMAEVAGRHGIATEVVAFEDWEPRGRTFDLATCGQAWHWLEPESSSAQAHSVIRHGGRLFLFWNVGSHPDNLAEPLESAYRRVLQEKSPELTRGYAANRASDPVDGLSSAGDFLVASGRFSNPLQKSFSWSRTYTTEEWIGELHSHSDHAVLEANLQEHLFDEIGRVIDANGGGFEMPYVTILISAAVARHRD